MKFRMLCAVGSILLLTAAANAATFCVTNGSQLNAAMLLAKGNGQNDLIKLATGFYTYPGSGGTFTYDPAPNSGETFDLELSGGWIAVGNDPCGQLPDSSTAFSTVLVGSGSQIMQITIFPNNASGDLTVRRLTFFRGGFGGLGIGALSLTSTGLNYSGTLRVDQCAFLENNAANVSALLMNLAGTGTAGTIRLSNSLFDDNRSSDGAVAWLAAEQGYGMYVGNTTFVNNRVTGPNSEAIPGLVIVAMGTTPVLAVNNNLWANQVRDLTLISENVILRNNNIGSRGGYAPMEDSNNLSVMPVYEDAASLNYTPAAGSPLINAGRQPPLIGPTPRPFPDNWSTGTRDLRSGNRIQGPKIDIGAFEAGLPTIFASGFE